MPRSLLVVEKLLACLGILGIHIGERETGDEFRGLAGLQVNNDVLFVDVILADIGISSEQIKVLREASVI